MAPPSIVHVPAPDLSQSSGGQTGGMTRVSAISDRASINASIMTSRPHTRSDVHHHGEQDTIIYALRGSGGAVLTEGGGKRTDLAVGDFVLIPAGVEHVEVNDGDDEVAWVITRSGRAADVVNLDSWSKKE